MGGGQPDPFTANVVHVAKDRCYGASVAGWFGLPECGVEVFDEELVDAVVLLEDLGGGVAEVWVGLGHGFCSPELFAKS